MFESNESKAKSNRALVAVTLKDGTTTTLSIRLPLTSKLSDALNNADAFLDVLEADGRQSFVAKHAIQRVELVDVPKVDQLSLQRRRSDNTMFDPFAVLGVHRGASQDEIKQAYYQMVRKYHPDRFATMDLPKEMIEYTAAMLVRINLANEQIGA
jgi:sRNA-binding regulator protein Hfq